MNIVGRKALIETYEMALTIFEVEKNCFQQKG
jgi:hypothetical protein